MNLNKNRNSPVFVEIPTPWSHAIIPRLNYTPNLHAHEKSVFAKISCAPFSPSLTVNTKVQTTK